MAIAELIILADVLAKTAVVVETMIIQSKEAREPTDSEMAALRVRRKAAVAKARELAGLPADHPETSLPAIDELLDGPTPPFAGDPVDPTGG